MLSESMEGFIREHEEEALELLKTIARIPAPSNHEEKRAQFCCQWLKEQGAEGVYIDEALNVVWPGLIREKNGLEVYMAHTDVVFPDEDELPLKEEGDRIFCPGIGDDTACLVCLLLAAKYLVQAIREDRLEEVYPSNRPGLLFVCNSGEEGLGNLKGVRKICEDYAGRITAFCTFDSQLDKIVDQAVGSKRFKITVRTQGGHSFNDFGRENAIERLAGIIGSLYRIQVPEQGRTTFNVGQIQGGTSVNTIAQEAHMLYEFRSDCRENLDYMQAQFEEVIKGAESEGVELQTEVLGLRPCSGDIDPERQKALLERACTAMEQVTGQRPQTGSGSTDCNIPMSLGIPSVCAGCYRGGGAHTREEYIEKSSLAEGLRAVFGMIFG